MLQGPDLLGVLLRFRQDAVAVTSDIEAMFHQVEVRSKDADALRFPWWPHANFSLQPHERSMQVHLFVRNTGGIEV